MKLKLPAILFVVAAAVRLMAAESAADALMLKANSITMDGSRMIATDQATLIPKGGQTRLTADKIVYDQSTSTYTLTGNVKVHAGGMTVETAEATVNAAGQRFIQLTGGQISISNDVPAIDANAPASTLPTFSEPMPKMETKLSAPR